MKPSLIAGLAATAAAIAAATVRRGDEADAERAWRALARPRPPTGSTFTPETVEGLPEPARRYFRFAIAPGTPLRSIAEIDMVGRIGLGDREAPNYRPMIAREILAPPYGFVWRPRIGTGVTAVTGSDGCIGDRAWTRFWLAGLVPVARTTSTADLVRSARARSVAEALWAPAALLPANGVAWEPLEADGARAIFEHAGEAYVLDLTVAPDGRPVSVSMQRWTNANPDRVFRFQPFGATVLETGTFEGYTIPTRIEGGNGFGTDAYFPFFQASVTSASFR